MTTTTIPPILLTLINMCYVAAEQDYIWTIRPYEDTIAFIDERDETVKMIITNPDADTTALIEEIKVLGWPLVKQKYLGEDEWAEK